MTCAGLMGVDSPDYLLMGFDRIVSADANAAKDSALPDDQRALCMAAAQSGDRKAYARVLADSVPLIRAVARRQGVRPDNLDDVVQETLITIHRVRHTYDPARPYDAWLSAIARRRAIDALRRRGRRSGREVHDEFALDTQADGEDASAATERQQRAEQLRAAIAKLPPGQRQAAEQLGLRERSLDETSELTGRKAGALKVNLHRAIKALRKNLSGDS